MGQYKDTSIWNLDALKRGYDYGRRVTGLFRDCMAAGHSLDTFHNLEQKLDSERWGLVSPIGEVVGKIASAKHLIIGGYYYVINRNKNVPGA